MSRFFFFNDTATTEIYTLSLHDALPICAIDWTRCPLRYVPLVLPRSSTYQARPRNVITACSADANESSTTIELLTSRSEEHTSELQSRQYLVCRLLLEKKNPHHQNPQTT